LQTATHVVCGGGAERPHWRETGQKRRAGCRLADRAEADTLSTRAVVYEGRTSANGQKRILGRHTPFRETTIEQLIVNGPLVQGADEAFEPIPVRHARRNFRKTNGRSTS